MEAKEPPVEPDMRGWLFKWTNYIKGYQKRWFVLSNGLLSYYRTQAEMAHTCRGTISLHGASIYCEDSCNLIISNVSNGGTHTFHLKTPNEVERQRWVTALELAKSHIIRELDSEEDAETDQDSDKVQLDVQAVVSVLGAKLKDLQTCHELIGKHCSSLHRSLTELESCDQLQEVAARVKAVNERASLFRITSTAMLKACGDYRLLSEQHGRRWQRLLQHERDQRRRLELMVEQLAKQHSHLEHEARLTLDANKMAAAHSSKKDGPAATGGSVSSDDEFEDATDDVAGQFSVACPANHKRTRSDLSQMSEGRGGVMLTESESSQDEDTSNMIEVITHKRGSRTSLSTRCKETGSSDRLSGNFTPSAATATDAASASSSTSSAGAAVVGIGDSTAGRARRQRRTVIPDKPNYPLSLWSIMKNCIGKELSKIPVPVNFSEPLSMLQRLTEDFEYSELLDRAAACTDSCEQLCLVAAFTVSSYATTAYRSSKPFNPLLGETYECDRRDDLGWRVISEQVSHHPPMLAQFCEGRGWECYQEFTMSSKFRGKYLQIIPMGVAHLHFHSSGNHYTWRKVTTSVHNIIVGRLWVDQHGDMEIVNHKTGDKCNLKYVPYSYFSRDVLRRVTGCVSDSAGTVRWVLMGTWDAQMECCRVLEPSGAVKQSGSSKPVIETAAPRVIWRVNKLPENADRVYNFTRLAVQLNEPEPGVCPTDCRLRPDQRLMETGDWDSANNEKLRLEEKQRSVRKLREQQAEQAAAEGAEFRGHQPCWFVRQLDQYTNQLVYMYTRQYWTCKEQQEWSRCPDIF